jgi:hypothetical protein
MLGLTALAYGIAHICLFAYDQNLRDAAGEQGARAGQRGPGRRRDAHPGPAGRTRGRRHRLRLGSRDGQRREYRAGLGGAGAGVPVRFFVQLLALDPAGPPREVFAAYLDETATLAPLARAPGRYAWRVYSVSRDLRHYAASEWQRFQVAAQD